MMRTSLSGVIQVSGTLMITVHLWQGGEDVSLVRLRHDADDWVGAPRA